MRFLSVIRTFFLCKFLWVLWRRGFVFFSALLMELLYIKTHLILKTTTCVVKNGGITELKLIIASNNKHKIYEIKKILGGKFDEILSIREAGIDHETIEDGTTFMENAVKKAREAGATTVEEVIMKALQGGI